MLICLRGPRLQISKEGVEKACPATTHMADRWVNTQSALPPALQNICAQMCKLAAHHIHQNTHGIDGYTSVGPHKFATCTHNGENQKWPTFRQGAYVTPAISGIATALERGGNQKWPTCGQSGYATPAVSRIPTASERGGKSDLATCGQGGYVTPAASGIPTASERGSQSEVAHLWAKWLRHPCRLGDPHRFRAGRGGKSESGPLVGKVATSTVPSRKSPPL